jgi:hypothetical protein
VSDQTTTTNTLQGDLTPEQDTAEPAATPQPQTQEVAPAEAEQTQPSEPETTPEAPAEPKPLDLSRALRPTNQGIRSTPLNPAWSGPPYLLGRIVQYVMPDGSDTEAKVLSLSDDGSAVLLVAVGVQGVDAVYHRQYGAVPLGRAGEVGTWHEADDG